MGGGTVYVESKKPYGTVSNGTRIRHHEKTTPLVSSFLLIECDV